LNDDVIVKSRRRWVSRLLAAVVVALGVCVGSLVGVSAAQASTFLYASQVAKSSGVFVSSPTFTPMRGGGARADAGADGWLAITSYGQTRDHYNMVYATVTTGPSTWSGWTLGTPSTAYNIAWWYYNGGSLPYQFLVSGRAVY
jgi:hypothetical protein